MLEIDKKLKDDVAKIAQNKLDILLLKSLAGNLIYEEIENSFKNLLFDVCKIVNEYLDDEYFSEIKEYKKKLLSYVVIYIDELKNNFLSDIRKYQSGIYEKKIYLEKIKKQPLKFAFYLTSALITSSTILINFSKIKSLYKSGGISKETYNIIKKKFQGENAQGTIKKIDDLTYIFICSIDKKTCLKCASMHGKKIKLSEIKLGINAPPLHPGCRCDISIIGEEYGKRN